MSPLAVPGSGAADSPTMVRGKTTTKNICFSKTEREGDLTHKIEDKTENKIFQAAAHPSSSMPSPSPPESPDSHRRQQPPVRPEVSKEEGRIKEVWELGEFK